MYKKAKAVDESLIERGELGMRLVYKTLLLVRLKEREREEFDAWVAGLAQAMIRAISSNLVQPATPPGPTPPAPTNTAPPPAHRPPSARLNNPAPSLGTGANSTSLGRQRRDKDLLKQKVEERSEVLKGLETPGVDVEAGPSEPQKNRKRGKEQDQAYESGRKDKKKIKKVEEV